MNQEIILEINASVDSATKSIDNLIGSMQKLSKVFNSQSSLDKFNKAISNLNTSVGNIKISDEVISKLERLAAALASLGTNGAGKYTFSVNGKSGGGNSGNGSENSSTSQTTTAPIAKDIQDAINSADDIDVLHYKLEELRDALEEAFAKGDYKGAVNLRSQIIQLEKRIDSLTRTTEKSTKGTKKAIGAFGNLASAFKRIVIYRGIRSIIAGLSSAMTEGLTNAYKYSKAIGGDLADALDGLSTKTLTMKNQLGAAWGTLLTQIQPILVTIISLVTKVVNALTQFFALLGGKTTYLKAIDYANDWADATSAGASAAEEWKNQLMGFDEINRLDDTQGSSGGGSGSSLDYSSMFEESELSNWAQKLKLTLDDIFFDASEVNAEKIAENLMFSLSTALGAIAGFTLGGVPGALIGSLIGGALGIWFDSFTFDHNGELSAQEVFSSILPALTAIGGALLGFHFGGIPGALVGASLGMSLGIAIGNVAWGTDELKAEQAKYNNKVSWFICGVLGIPTDQEIIQGAKNLVFNLFGAMYEAEESSVGGGFGGYSSRAAYSSNLDWFLCGKLGLPTDQELIEGAKNLVSTFWKGITGAEENDSIGTELYHIFVEPFKNAIEDIKTTFSNFTLPHIKMPHISVSWEATSGLLSYLGINQIPHFSVDYYANGGFPTAGQLFIANEAGAEMVGSMGGHTAVANNQEIVEGIKQGVLEAMLTANGNGKQSVNVYLDGKQLADSVSKWQRTTARAMGV